MTRTGSILLVEDDRENCLLLKEILTKWGHAVSEAFSGAEALRLAEKDEYDIVLTDIRMIEVDGLAVLKWFRRNRPASQVITMTGFGSIETAVDAMQAGAFDYISKPFKFDEIRLALDRAMENRARAAGTVRTVGEAPEQPALVGHSRAMADVYKTIAKVSQGGTTVLIQGESGTGKELVARAIHRHGVRAVKPFVAVNCAALPDTLLESELFGYARGAHSTATEDKAGLFETASGGVLFLDEIGDTSLSLQAKLLRAIEDGEIRRLGDMRTIRTDVQIIASTNKEMPTLVREDRFRADLWYRLNVVSITLPALRERREDILALTEHFIRHYSALYHKNVTHAAPGVLQRLHDAAWPGNVRELENVIERAVILNTKSVIELEDLPPSILSPQASSVVLSLEEMERRQIVLALRETKGNVRAAAGLLGIDRKTLYRKAAEYGIELAREREP